MRAIRRATDRVRKAIASATRPRTFGERLKAGRKQVIRGGTQRTRKLQRKGLMRKVRGNMKV